jgi:signal peptide peptidase SppA
MRFFRTKPLVPVLRLSGVIGAATPLRQGLSLAMTASAIEKAFSMSDTPSVAVQVNSPGGSPVQSSLILQRIRQLAEEKKKRVYVFCEDVAASGGYYIALAGDEIYADASSIIGSIGVISSGFGFDKAIDKLGIERRVYTAGHNKNILDPFKPEKEEDVARLKALQLEVHEVFMSVVKERRQNKLKGDDSEIFSGAFWSAEKSTELGLIDGISEVRGKMKEIHGKKVRLRLVPPTSGGFLSRLLKRPSVTEIFNAYQDGASLSDDVISSVEARQLWARFGL